MAANATGILKPFRPLQFRKVLEDRIPEPEFTFPTEEKFTIDLAVESHELKFNPRVQAEFVKQWVNKTEPTKRAFENGSDISSFDNTYEPHYKSPPLSLSACDSDNLEEKWRQREFDRLFGDMKRTIELRKESEKPDARKVEEKLNRYKKAFLKGFYEARIRRIESNKWLYEKLHVKTDYIKEKYRQLMYHSQTQYVPALAPQTQQQTEAEAPQNRDAETGTDSAAKDADDQLENMSVYSFTPERDNVLLQDVETAPEIRGFGNDKRHKYDPRVRLMQLENWISPDIQEWMNEKKLQEAQENDEIGSRSNISLEGARDNQRYANDEMKYEEIQRGADMTAWLGPKLLDHNERDLETFPRAMSADGNVSVEADEDGRPGPNAAEKRATADEDNESVESKTVSETPSNCLLRQLIQAQSKDYYRLWYSTHDTYNTTPFLEARLQRLMREVFGKKEWSTYCTYLEKKTEQKLKKINENVTNPIAVD